MKLSCGVVFFAAIAVCISASAMSPPPLEIWLASTSQCNSCAIYEDVARRRMYGDTLRYVHAEQTLDIPIKRVSKTELPPWAATQIVGDYGPQSPYWPLTLTVIVVRGTKVLSFGNIADSADMTQWRFAPTRMFPPSHPAPSDPSVMEVRDEYAPYFRDNWNLEYFVAVALADRPSRAPTHFVDLESPATVPLARTNVILWGAASTPLANRQFTAQRLQDIRPILYGYIPPSTDVRYITLYGHGPNSRENDTSSMSGGVISFFRADLPADFGADARSLGIVLTSIERSDDTRNLIVLAGHSGPTGAPLWGQLGTLSAEDLSKVGVSARHEVVMISGGCNSGVFARSVSCGFFAAHPEVIASGCQLTQQAIEHSDDYLRLFFKGLTGAAARDADVDGDGKVSLSEAHWYASTRIEDHQISYTSGDALADAYFTAHPTRLPKTLTISEIRALGAGGSPEKRAALQRLTDGKDPRLVVSLDDLVAQNHTAFDKLKSSTELTSRQRNAILALPYKLMLPMLVRRLIYESVADASLKPIAACEAQGLADFQH
jgi:hypothetical protein